MFIPLTCSADWYKIHFNSNEYKTFFLVESVKKSESDVFKSCLMSVQVSQNGSTISNETYFQCKTKEDGQIFIPLKLINWIQIKRVEPPK